MTALPSRVRSGARAVAAVAEALLTPHGVDRYLELLDPMLVRDEIRGVVTEVRRQTASTVTLSVRPSRTWPGFTAGQHVRVAVDIDGVRHTRCYSPACSEHRQGTIELTVKAAPDGLVSRHLRAEAAPGTVLGLSTSDGEFTMPTARPERLLLISGGSGITPVLSMLRTLADERHRGEVVFLHYADDADDTPYRAELAAIAAGNPGFRVVLAHTRTSSGADLHGRFTHGHLTQAAPWFRAAQTYLCGPAPLMEAVRAVFAEAGASGRLHTEAFTAPALEPEATEATGRVRFARSGKEADNSGRPLLEQAETAGLTPEHGCRMGICFSCTQVKRTGRVRDLRSGRLSDEDGERIQLCVSAPVGDVEIDC